MREVHAMGNISVQSHDRKLPNIISKNSKESRRMETVERLEEIVRASLVASEGIKEERAALIAHEIVGEIINVHGGTTLVIPSSYWLRTKNREKAVIAAFTGGNIADLAREHGITERAVYKIIERDRLRRIEAKKASSL